MRFHLNSISALFVVVIACTGCNLTVDKNNELSVAELVSSFDKIECASPGEVQAVLDNASACEQSVSYINADWSIDSILHRTTFAHFAVDYHRTTQRDPALIHFIDCTLINSANNPFNELPGWDKREYSIAGMGEVIWMQNGRVLHVEAIGNFKSTEEMITKTEVLFRNGG